MQWFEDAWKRRDLPRPVVATIGNYDGVHRGQLAILERLVTRARSLDLPAVVITFRPHPLTVVAPERAPRSLTSQFQKREALASAGIDAVVVPFARAEAFGVSDLIDPRQTRPMLCDWIDWIQPRLRDHRGPRTHAIRP